MWLPAPDINVFLTVFVVAVDAVYYTGGPDVEAALMRGEAYSAAQVGCRSLKKRKKKKKKKNNSIRQCVSGLSVIDT